MSTDDDLWEQELVSFLRLGPVCLFAGSHCPVRPLDTCICNFSYADHSILGKLLSAISLQCRQGFMQRPSLEDAWMCSLRSEY